MFHHEVINATVFDPVSLVLGAKQNSLAGF